MSYGNTYTREPTREEISQRDSLVTLLSKESGYNREGFDNVELEVKLDLSFGCLFWRRYKLRLGEEISLIEPYSKDKVLESRETFHSCYGFIGEKIEEAFIVVNDKDSKKIKIKSKPYYIKNNRVIIIKRDQKDLSNLTSVEINSYISKIARESNKPLEFIGGFEKQSKELFVFNPTSGRVFVLSTNICKKNSSLERLCQMEIEYYGQINGFVAYRDVYNDLATLTNGLLKNLSSRYTAKVSTLTKFDWIVQGFKE